MRRTRLDSMNGFTLMELLVSMTLIGILALAIHYGFRIGISAWNKGENGLQTLRSNHAVIDLLNRQLGSMVPYYSSQRMKDSQVEVLVYQGAEGGMRFVSTFSCESRSSQGLRLVEYLTVRSEGGGSLSLLINDSPLPDDKALKETIISGISQRDDFSVVAEFLPIRPHKDSVTLIEGLDEVKFKFYSKPENDRSSTGLLLAKKRENLPVGVALKLRWKEAGFYSARELSTFVPIVAAL